MSKQRLARKNNKGIHNKRQNKKGWRLTEQDYWDIEYHFDDFSEMKDVMSIGAFRKEIQECFSLYVEESMNWKKRYGYAFTDRQHNEIIEKALTW